MLFAEDKVASRLKDDNEPVEIDDDDDADRARKADMGRLALDDGNPVDNENLSVEVADDEIEISTNY